MRYLATLTLLSFIFGAHTFAQTTRTFFGQVLVTENGSPATTPTSLVAIVSDRDDWHGRLIEVSGWFQFSYGSASLFLSSEYCDRLSMQNGILIDVSALGQDFDLLNLVECTFATVQGRFKALPRERPSLPLGLGEGTPNMPPPGAVEAAFIMLETVTATD